MNRRLVVAVLVGGLPWTILVFDGSVAGGVDGVFAWGLLGVDPLHVVTVTAYLFEYTGALPDRLLAWPVSTLLYGAALGSTLVGTAVGREDRRVTAGAFAFAGASNLVFTLGIARRNPAVLVALPVGAALLWGLAWWSWRR